MTRWKRVLLLAWVVGVVLLAGTWVGSRLMVLEARATLGRNDLMLAVRGGSLQVGKMDHFPGPGSRSGLDIRSATSEEAAQRNLRLGFLPVPFPDMRILNTPIWFLILLHTAVFAVLHLLAHRHFKKKTIPRL